jgi:diguanylate cyclase (GGDEF)-like protein
LRTRRELAEAREALHARITELATLHAIGREILSSIDPGRVFSIVERECRKIFDYDCLSIALVDRETRQIRIPHRQRRGDPASEAGNAFDEAVAAWVARYKRPLRVDDVAREASRLPRELRGAASEVRALLAVPLIVGDDVTGVLAVGSARPGAYDDHLLSVLTTVAQQAAVAIENARHYEMATVDSLTGLFLRPYFFRRLDEEYTRARRYGGAFGLLMLDLDGFKAINDRHGHLVGDRYLRALGAAVQGELRGADLACRYGGDEFCLLLPETDLSGARAIAERVRTAVAALVVHVDSLAIRTTTSIGVAAFPATRAADPKTLLRKADEALYRAKQMGRDRVVPAAA